MKLTGGKSIPQPTRVPIYKRGDVTLRPGDHFRVEDGRRGQRFRFVAYVIGVPREDGTRDRYVECVEVRGVKIPKERAGVRAVRPETVRRDK